MWREVAHEYANDDGWLIREPGITHYVIDDREVTGEEFVRLYAIRSEETP